MDKQQTMQTKDAALYELGLTKKRARSRVSPHVDFASVDVGRKLLTTKTLMPTVIVGTSGSANVSRDGTHLARLEAPFVIDFWAGDDQRVALIDVVAGAETRVLFVDWRRRQTVFELLPALEQLSGQTEQLVSTPVIDLTVDVTEPSPVHT